VKISLQGWKEMVEDAHKPVQRVAKAAEMIISVFGIDGLHRSVPRQACRLDLAKPIEEKFQVEFLTRFRTLFGLGLV
jgi:hypothetical protein